MNLEIFPDKSTNKNRFQHQKLCFGFLVFSRNSSFSVFFIFAEKKYIMIIGQNLVLVAKNIESFPPLSSIPSCLIDVNINIHKQRSPFSPPSLTFGLKCQGRKFEHGNAKNPKLLQKHLMMIHNNDELNIMLICGGVCKSLFESVCLFVTLYTQQKQQQVINKIENDALL